jgi:hypothetical protein
MSSKAQAHNEPASSLPSGPRATHMPLKRPVCRASLPGSLAS